MTNVEQQTNAIQQKKGRQSGFTMVELAVALVIIAILMAGMYSIISSRVDKSKATNFAEELVQSAINLQNRHATQGAVNRFDGLDLDNAAVALTENIRNSRNAALTEIVLEWGATVTLDPVDETGATGGDATNIMFSVNDVPQAQCEAMLTVFATPSSLILNGGTALRDRSINEPLAPADITTVCTDTTANNDFEVVF